MPTPEAASRNAGSRLDVRSRALRRGAWFAVLMLLVFLLVRPALRPDPKPDSVPDLRVPSSAPSELDETETPRPYPPSPLPSTATPPPIPNAKPAPYAWGAQVKSLRPDLVSPEVVMAPDATPDLDQPVIAAGKTWVLMTGEGILGRESTAPDARIRLHGLDAVTGRRRWQLAMPYGLCGSHLLDGKLACASGETVDETTGLPTRWRLQLVDPASGKVTASTTVDGWFTMAAVQSDRFILVEQAQPAPKLVVHAFTASLAPAWRTDLSVHPLHAGFFSGNRFVTRHDLTVPKGLALEKVRLRQVDQMLALWGTRHMAFLDLTNGKVRGVLACSRLVDDGVRIWCNEQGRAAAYSRDLKPLFRTAPGVRLAHPRVDRRHGDRSVPVFVNQHGQVVGVNRAMGKTQGVIADTSAHSTVADALEPIAVQAGGSIFIDDASGVIGLDQSGTKAVWAVQDYVTLEVLSHGKQALLSDQQVLDVVDPVTGAVSARFKDLPGYTIAGVGNPADDAIISVGLDGLWRLRLP
ncbi:hypothetical protein AAEX63_00760 [Luteococcus sp. H138]|uniref:hypothetical protein n=1 Tax=unclassified Luteococcus TaxID=2639923 RepID=UPI00313BB6E3